MRLIPSLVPLALVPILLAGCTGTASGGSASDDATATAAVSIVASTNVYGDIAGEIGGDAVSVTSIIDDPTVDPHSFEGSARVQLALSSADIVIVNGGGYDDWATTLLDGAGNDEATVLNAVDISGYDTSGEFNEHVWYDFPTVLQVAQAIADAITAADPDAADAVTANLAAFDSSVDDLETRESGIAATASGTGVAITEPVPLYMLEACGLDNVTPSDFSEAIEEGDDVPPLALAETLALFDDGTAALLVYNEQTSSAETEQVLAAAQDAGVPVVPVTETEPADTDYATWMGGVLDDIETGLAS
ncbi:MAG: zinc ABC transporter substrate-binding protein [Microbacteriaceae bacterium]